MKVYMIISGKTGKVLELYKGETIFYSTVGAGEAFMLHKRNNRHESPVLVSFDTVIDTKVVERGDTV